MQHDYSIDNDSGAVVRADINDAFEAAVTRNSGTSAPSTTYANMTWPDTTNHVEKVRNQANTGWIIRGRTDAEGVLAKTANYTLALRDFGKLIDATSGTWTLTLMAAATATDGFWFELRNSGTGVVTIDGDSSETIDGLTTITLEAGEFVRVQCNGTLWRSDRIARLGSLPENIQTDTYTILVTDRGKLNIANKATAMTFNLPAAATAGKGFVLFYKNIGAGTLTIDGSASETVDGAATKSVAQNESGVLECDGSNWRTLLTGGSGSSAVKMALVRDEKADATDGGGGTASAWTTRDLQSEVFDPDGIVSIAANQFTLGVGKYVVQWRSPFAEANKTVRTKLRNVTDSTDIVVGTGVQTAGSTSGNAENWWSEGVGYVDIASPKAFAIQYYMGAASTGRDLGDASALGIGNEVYTEVLIMKIG